MLLMLTSLAVGHSVVPRDIACCEITVNLPAFPVHNTCTADYAQNVFEVNDLPSHPTLHARPYVSEWPTGRSYVGVPITTPEGINIGAYCVLDDQPREAASQTEILFMRDMSQTVMSHLETVRALSERSQRNRLVTGLGSFVRNTTYSKPQQRPTGTVPLADETADHRPKRRSTTTTPLADDNSGPDMHTSLPSALIDPVSAQDFSSSQGDYFDQTAVDRQKSEQPTVDPSNDSVLRSPWTDDSEIANQSRENHSGPRLTPKSTGATSSGTARPPLPTQNPADLIRSTYQRAAETLCQSLQIDGVAFLDASVAVFGGLGEGLDSPGTSSECESDDSASAYSSSERKAAKPQVQSEKACSVLGCAQTVRQDADTGQPSTGIISESVLRGLLRRYPAGHVWLYDENGSPYSEDGGTTTDTTDTADDGRSASKRARKASRSDRKSSSSKERRNDSERLQLAFPGARCIAIHGIYDQVRKRWAVGSLFWTYNPFRVLTLETEMHFINTFCDIIVAETKRLESVGSDKAKSDFISTISHELRSPLHGILGSVEILSELGLGTTASTLIEQIDSCGHTLLQIIDHLLEFANLKVVKRQTRRSHKGLKGRRSISSSSAGASIPTTMHSDMTLDTATEEAVVSAAYSFYYNQSDDNRTNVPVILDIDHNAAATWSSGLPMGGWKRVCLNIVTNALKYTPAGFVHVELKQKPRPGFRRRNDVVLTVSDSGIGMSKEFQKTHLFRDFSQEDPTSNGLGLGMHMVSQMLTVMGGKIEVNSATGGTGTRVVVTVPHDSDKPTDGMTASENQLSDTTNLISAACKDLTVSVVTESVSSLTTRELMLQHTASKMAIASIGKKCSFLGLRTHHSSIDASASADIRLIAALDVDACLQSMHDEIRTNPQAKFASTLVVCNNTPAQKELEGRWINHPLRKVAVLGSVALPCSLKQLVRALESILQACERLEHSPAPVFQSSSASHVATPTAIDDVQGRLTATCDSQSTQTAIPSALPTHRDNEIQSSAPTSFDQAIESVLQSNRRLEQLLTAAMQQNSTPNGTSAASNHIAQITVPTPTLLHTPPVASAEHNGDTPTTGAPPTRPETQRRVVADSQTASANVPRRSFASETTLQHRPSPTTRPSIFQGDDEKSTTPPDPVPRSLPTHASSSTPTPGPSHTDTPTATAAPNDPVLLIVDDNPVNLQLLKMFAHKAGYAHTTATDGELAVKAFCSAHEASRLPPQDAERVGLPNVVLMDINMPVMDGYEATQRIRHYEKRHDLPPSMIIAVTALYSEAAHVEAYGSGFDLFLSKPVRLRELAGIIEDRLKGG